MVQASTSGPRPEDETHFGFETVRLGPGPNYTMWPQGYPDFPMDQRLEVSPLPGTVTISCLVSDLVFRWQLREHEGGTEVNVHVELPDREAHRLADQRRLLEVSLTTLTRLAA